MTIAFLAGAGAMYAFLVVVNVLAHWEEQRRHAEKVERDRRTYEAEWRASGRSEKP